MSGTKTNRLAQESSPYLLQHAGNPVDWYPWGSEATDRAKREDKPIFLSIGYSACHWCHVMERESFEDAETADLLNREFVSIKVDREERPDIDHIYMSAVQAMTQHGGWPLSVFLTPGLEPFYGGTYFPPEDRHGLPSFKRLIGGISQAWKTRRDEVTRNAAQLTAAVQQLQSQTRGLPSTKPLSTELLDAAATAIAHSFDTSFGGLGSAPKFFHSMSFRLALRHWHRTRDPMALKMVTHTLDHVSRGGIRDHLGGGFHRYSTDAEWLVPHFEKMLYDNALLAELYLETFQATGHPELADVARHTIDYVLREMTSPEGGFFSTQDADSEGVEGKFYVWKPEEVMSVLGDELGRLFCDVYDVTPSGNWEGHSILRLKRPVEERAKELGHPTDWMEDQLATARRKLFAERNLRVKPGRDEKVLLSWNGLMLSALALGHQVLGDERYLEAARTAGRFLLTAFAAADPLPSGKIRLLHSRKDGKSRFNGCLEDYAFLLDGLIRLYESDFDPFWVESAQKVADSLIDQFWEESEKILYFTGRDHEKLIARPREWHDGALPAGQSVAVTALLRLYRLTGKQEYDSVARGALEAAEPLLRLAPTGTAQMLMGLQMAVEPFQEWVLVPGNDPEEFTEAATEVWTEFHPSRVIAAPHPQTPSGLALLKGRVAQSGKVTLYVCEGFACQAPVVGLEAIRAELSKWNRPNRSSK